MMTRFMRSPGLPGQIPKQHFPSSRRMIGREGFYTLFAISGRGDVAGGGAHSLGGKVLHLRVAEMRDAEAIVLVINAAFRQAEGFLIDRDRIDLEEVRQLLQSGNFLVADDLGFVSGCVYVEQRGDRSYLGLLSVDPRRQKSGLGSKLMS